MIPKLRENSERQIICNSEIHDCWVKDCIKNSRLLHTDQPSPCLWMCARQAFVVRSRCASLHRHRLGQVSWTVHLESNRGFLYNEIHDRECVCWPHVADKKPRSLMLTWEPAVRHKASHHSETWINLNCSERRRVTAVWCINVRFSVRTAARFGSVQNASLRGSARKSSIHHD